MLTGIIQYSTIKIIVLACSVVACDRGMFISLLSIGYSKERVNVTDTHVTPCNRRRSKATKADVPLRIVPVHRLRCDVAASSYSSLGVQCFKIIHEPWGENMRKALCFVALSISKYDSMILDTIVLML